MKCLPHTTRARRNEATTAMTLVEVIGVLAVTAVLAGVLIPVALRILDRIAHDKEAASLRTLGDAFQMSIMKTRSIPAQAGWPQFIATNAGIDVYSVTNNLRKRTRVLVFDKGSTWFLANLPYSQSASSCTAIPDKPRVMLASSIAGQLPFTDLTAGQFDSLWNTPEGSLPAGLGLNGDPYDVQIQRMNLAPLFVNLLVSTYKPGTYGNGYFGFENKAPLNPAPYGAGVSAYYLRGTVLNLCTSADTNIPPVHTQILQEDSSFVFETNVWESSIVGPIPVLGSGDLASVVDAFLKAYPNPNAFYYTNNFYRTQQFLVASTMAGFMSNYYAWATNGFPNNWKTSLGNTQAAMMNAIWGLYTTHGSFANIPAPNLTNNAPPFP
jgi:type II secretory pathway pseudopilin PulG